MIELFKTFLNMGGYALYVWLVYGAALLVILINIILPLLSYRQIIKKVKQKRKWQ